MPTVKVDWKNLPKHPDSEKSVPIREEDCILCMACVTQCPTEAITVEE